MSPNAPGAPGEIVGPGAPGETGAAGPDDGTVIRPAATVVLLRDTADGLQTWLLGRVRQMAFAPGMWVFPGGAVDPTDGSDDVPWVGDEPASVAARFECSVALARACLVAATRETFEETGVLLTSPPHPGGAALADARRGVEERRVTFGAMLIEAGLSVDASLIRPWARWITPPNETRRFDTFFYVAVLPAGAQAQADSGEAVHAEWVRPADALAQFQGGERPLLPPTLVALSELTAFERAADVLAASEARLLRPTRPKVETAPDGRRRIVIPDGTVFLLPGPPTQAQRSAPPPGLPDSG